MPGAIAGTLVTMPANGAVTTVWSSCRCASSTCALRLAILRVVGRGDVRIAAELGELHFRLLLQRGELALVVFERVARLIEHRLRYRGAFQQHGVAIVVCLIEVDLRLLRGDVAQHALVILLHRVDRHRDLREIGLGVVERDLELTRIQPVENLPGFDVLIVLDRDVLHDARDVGGNADLRSACT